MVTPEHDLIQPKDGRVVFKASVTSDTKLKVLDSVTGEELEDCMLYLSGFRSNGQDHPGAGLPGGGH